MATIQQTMTLEGRLDGGSVVVDLNTSQFIDLRASLLRAESMYRIHYDGSYVSGGGAHGYRTTHTGYWSGGNDPVPYRKFDSSILYCGQRTRNIQIDDPMLVSQFYTVFDEGLILEIFEYKKLRNYVRKAIHRVISEAGYTLKIEEAPVKSV